MFEEAKLQAQDTYLDAVALAAGAAEQWRPPERGIAYPALRGSAATFGSAEPGVVVEKSTRGGCTKVTGKETKRPPRNAERHARHRATDLYSLDR